MLILYRLLTTLIYLVAFPILRLRAASGDLKWRHRLGLIPADESSDIWLHASSVGEVKVISYLLQYLRDKKPALRMRLTVMTDAGFKVAQQLDIPGLAVGFLPLDSLPTVRRSMQAINPAVLVIAETEIWPNLIMEADRRSVPQILVNGRMTERAFRRYNRATGFMRHLLSRYDHFFFKTDEDASRYRQLGVADEKSIVAGDMKFDAPLLPRSEGRRAEIRYRLGVSPQDFLIVAGSTRKGEEALLLEAFATRLSADGSAGLRLVMAPRHLERIDDVKQMCIDAGVRYAIYGDSDVQAQVILINQMGVLSDLYMASDICFVGGTLVDIGGHNVLEPVWAGSPVLFGPHVSNVLEAATYILSNNYGAQVSTGSELAEVVAHVQAGETRFTIKSDDARPDSATARAGDYILGRLSDV
ncbi:MAG: hypothetical protein KOO62_10935 [candidate division Zixibacteria bacterium]|nr:hypothetical protein [candidate division Zixibacteria bacterium]